MSVENPAVPLSSLAEGDDTYDSLTGGPAGSSGVKVNRRTALGLSAVWRGVNLIAGDVGRHSFRVYRYDGAGLVADPLHRAARVMRRPNDYMTPFTFRQTLQAHALLSGNGYAYIVRSPIDGFPMELLPLDPDRTWPVRVNGELWYVSQSGEPVKGKRRNGAMVKIRASDMLHIKGLGSDGLVGYPVLKVLRETLGAAVAARDYGARYFKNDASPGVVLIVPAGMKDAAVANLRKTWGAMHEGFTKSHRPAILRDGVTLAPFAKATARDAQMLESRAFDAREVANVLGVPPHKVGDPSRTAYNSLESENQGYQEDTLDRWFVAWEQECDAKLLLESEKASETHCCKFDPRPLARVPLAQRGAYYSTMINAGVLNVDECRGFENMNPLPDGKGKVYRSPVNLAPATAPAPITEPAPEPEGVKSE